jgi:murein endopeptidase
MELDPQLKKALEKLAKGGKKIGEPTMLGGELVVPVNGVLLTREKIFASAQISPKPEA